MITIRSSAASSKPTLIGLEVILTTARGTYMISSNGSVADFQLPFWRRPFWGDILAAIAISTRSRSRPGTANIFATRWISSCILLATTRSIAAASAAHNQALLFWLRPTLLSRCRFPSGSRTRGRSAYLVAQCARTKSYRGYKWRISQWTDAIHWVLSRSRNSIRFIRKSRRTRNFRIWAEQLSLSADLFDGGW